MAFTAGVGNNQASGTNGTPTCTLNGCTAGRHLMVGLVWQGAGVTVTSLDVSGESLTPVGSQLDVGDGAASHVQLYYVKDIQSSGNKTVSGSVSSGSAWWGLFVEEVQGGDTTTFEDGGSVQSATNQQTGSTVAFGTLTTSNANSMIWGILSCQSTTPTLAGHTITAGPSLGLRMHRDLLLDAGAAGGNTMTFGINQYGYHGYKGAAFKLAGGGGGAPALMGQICL